MAKRQEAPQRNSPTITFHTKTFGANIEFDPRGLRANRHTSFDNGITFSSVPIEPDQRIYLKVINTDDSRQWLGSLAIGFTQIDPSSIPRADLARSALPNLSKTTGISYIKRIFETLTKDIILTFYFNRNGAFYVLDGKEHDLYKPIDTKKPLWAVIDIYGNVKSIELTTAPQKVADSRAFFDKFSQNPDKLPIRHFTGLESKDLQSVSFCKHHGPEVDLYCQEKVVLRKNIHQLERPYVFIDLGMKSGDELYLRILSVDPNYRTPGVLGFTNALPPDSVAKIVALPPNDPAGLVDRLEFWILGENVFDEKLAELDELRIAINQSGEIHLWRNDFSEQSKRLVAFSDPSIAFYPFLFLNGRINALSIMGLKSDRRIENIPVPKTPDEDADMCQICWGEKANCVLIPCGHMFFCVGCRENYESSARAIICPVCRNPYTDAVEVADD